MNTLHTHVEPREAPVRLDVFLLKSGIFQKNGISLTRNEIAHMARNGLVSINEKKTSKAGVYLRGGEKISVTFEQKNNTEKTMQSNPSINIPIIFESDDFIIIEKPAGIQTHPSRSNSKDTIVNWLLARYPNIRDVGEDAMRPGIVHRLDKNTSGVMIIAKNNTAFAAFKDMFKERSVYKTYIAFAHGTFSKVKGVIDAPIAKSKNFRRQTIADTRQRYKGAARPAVTYYKVIKQHESYAEIETHPQTGRTHQIRIHLASIGHPIVGDTLYAHKQNKRSKTASRQLLHASEIAFELYGKSYHFTSALPADFLEYKNEK